MFFGYWLVLGGGRGREGGGLFGDPDAWSEASCLRPSMAFLTFFCAVRRSLSHVEMHTKKIRVGYRPAFPVIQLQVFS